MKNKGNRAMKREKYGQIDWEIFNLAMGNKNNNKKMKKDTSGRGKNYYKSKKYQKEMNRKKKHRNFMRGDDIE